MKKSKRFYMDVYICVCVGENKHFIKTQFICSFTLWCSVVLTVI